MIFPFVSSIIRYLKLNFNKNVSNENSSPISYKSIGGVHHNTTQVIHLEGEDANIALKDLGVRLNVPRPLPKIQPKQAAIYVPINGELKRIPTQEELDLVLRIREQKPYNSITDVGIVLNEDGTIDKVQWNEN